ncbi:flagellar biosynthesis protein FlgL [bacterium]|nr:flagellar biosynthesis protein FlgL [bacterium]MBU1990006.1 flagellar biosynthesis protein FlgL [bacterium]
MRVTSSMYYQSLYGQNNSQLNSKLFDVNKQIASGMSIQYAKDDVRTFSETMRLDNEVVVLGQIKKSTQSGYKISNQTDVVLNEFETSMNRMRTLLLQAANGTNDEDSLDAIAAELRGVEDHFMSLSNTSINGQYLFSGSAVNTKPIAADGTYMGNGVSMNAFLGSGVKQQYNLSGADLFLGEEVLQRREITTNVPISNLSTKYPDFTDSSVTGKGSFITSGDTIRDMMGDTDNVIDTVNAKHHFYIRGATSNGTSFKEQISMRDDETLDELLKQIGDIYGNTPNLKVVNVSLNPNGQIVVQDKMKGSSKLEFHMIGAVDFSGGGAANVSDLDLLDGGETNFDEIINPTSPPANNLFIREFVRSNSVASGDSAITNIDGLLYDRTQFHKSGSKLSANVSQILKDTNTFASSSTKISEVADISKGTAGTLDGSRFKLVGTNINGAAFDVQIDFATAGSTFSLDGGVTNYDIFNMNTPRSAVAADEMTYQQLMDVVNIVVTDNIPASVNIDTDYDSAVYTSTFSANTYLSYDGKLQFEQIGVTDTKASLSMHDANSGDFSLDASLMTFNSNNAITVSDPKTDFFKVLDEMISAVENHKLYPDDSKGDIRNVGIENAITMMDNLRDHVSKAHARVGAQSNELTASLERTELLELSTMTLRSSVVDTDLAEASLKLTQLTLNYEAMLSTVGRVSKLSLVNYL